MVNTRAVNEPLRSFNVPEGVRMTASTHSHGSHGARCGPSRSIPATGLWSVSHQPAHVLTCRSGKQKMGTKLSGCYICFELELVFSIWTFLCWFLRFLRRQFQFDGVHNVDNADNNATHRQIGHSHVPSSQAVTSLSSCELNCPILLLSHQHHSAASSQSKSANLWRSTIICL